MSKTYTEGKRLLRDGKRKGKEYDIKRILFYEIYKTGEDPYISEPYRIVGKLMDCDIELYSFDVMWAPSSCHLDEKWIAGSQMMMSEFSGLQSSKEAFKKFVSRIRMLSDYSISNKRIILCGFGNHGGGDMLFKKWFSENTESWEYGKIFYPASIDLMGASSPYMVDVIDRVGGLDLEWCSCALLQSVDLSRMNDPMYRIETMVRLHKSKVCKKVHLHTALMMEKKLLRNNGKLNNLKRDNK